MPPPIVLWKLAEDGDLIGCEDLLRRGKDVDGRGRYRETPLGRACEEGHYDVAELLISHGANINDNDNRERFTPLMNAAQGGHLRIVEMLCRRGAYTGGSNSSGNTAVSLARTNGHQDVVRFIHNWEQSQRRLREEEERALSQLRENFENLRASVQVQSPQQPMQQLLPILPNQPINQEMGIARAAPYPAHVATTGYVVASAPAPVNVPITAPAAPAAPTTPATNGGDHKSHQVLNLVSISDLLQKHVSSLVDSLECPVCCELPALQAGVEVLQCQQGHVFCSTCRASMESCPQCRQTLAQNTVRNRKVEEIIEKLTHVKI